MRHYLQRCGRITVFGLRGSSMRRRDFITVGGAAVAWPMLASAQRSFRRLGVLMGTEPTDAEGQARLAALRKWLGLLKEVSPKVTHVAVLYHPHTAPYAASFLEPLQAVAAASSVQVQPAEIQDASDVERVISTLPINSSYGLVVIPSVFMSGHRDLIVAAAARHAVPAIYPFRFFATAGGLIAYGADGVDLHSRAASYVDRILKGAKPAELPVQQPTKYEL